MYGLVIRQAENDIDADLHFFWKTRYGLSLWRHNFIKLRQMKSM